MLCKPVVFWAVVFLALGSSFCGLTRAADFDKPNRFLRDRAIRYGDRNFDPPTKLVRLMDPHYGNKLDVCQASLEYAAALLAADQQLDRANAVVSSVLDHQDIEPDSPTFGNFLWWHSETQVHDRNAVCFMSPWLSHIAIEYNEKLTAENGRRLHEALRRCIPAVRAHRTGVGYTNIWLLKAASMVTLGRALGESELEADGARRIDRWIQYTAENGITEYNSPCYNAVDVFAMEWIYHYATDDALRQKVAQCLNYLYADVFQHWHWQAGIGAGPHSRAYEHDRDTGRSLVASLVFKQCGQPGPPLRQQRRSFIYVFAVNDYPVPAPIRAAARKDGMYPFRLRERISQGSSAVECSLYMTAPFSLGTATRRSVAYDLPLKITYAGTKTERRSSYITPIPSTGPAKMASLQDGPAAIVLYEADLKNAKLDTAIMRLRIEPVEGGMVDEMRVAGQAYDRRKIDLAAGSLIGWRVGETLVAVRLLEARTAAGSNGSEAQSATPYQLGPVRNAGLCLDGLLTPTQTGLVDEDNLNCGFVIACATTQEYSTLADFLHLVDGWAVTEKVASDRREIAWRAGDARLELVWDGAANRVASEQVDGRPVDRRLRYDSPLIHLADGETPVVVPLAEE